MTAINKQPGRHEIEELLPWYARGTLSGRDAERVEQALAGDRELARRYELVRRAPGRSYSQQSTRRRRVRRAGGVGRSVERDFWRPRATALSLSDEARRCSGGRAGHGDYRWMYWRSPISASAR